MALKPNSNNSAQAPRRSAARSDQGWKFDRPDKHSSRRLSRDPSQAEKHLAVLVKATKDEVWVPA